MMSDIESLTELVKYQYAVEEVALRPLHQHLFEGRGIYRLEQKNKSTWLLRAFKDRNGETTDWLAGCAAVLLFLEQQDYPAPRVIRTVDGATTAQYQDWSALVLTFVEGRQAASSLENLRRLGSRLGQLDTLDVKQAATVVPSIPASRWRPGRALSSLLERLSAMVHQIPTELQELYGTCLDTLQRVNEWSDLPTALLHTDCWISNTIQTPDGKLVLIDWDGAGLGPTVLDIGYLLVTCHFGLPEWPRLIPNVERVQAVVDGYCQYRRLIRAELSVLPEAVRFAIIFHDARDFPEMLRADWWNQRLQRFQGRYPAIAEITRLARGCFEQYQ